MFALFRSYVGFTVEKQANYLYTGLLGVAVVLFMLLMSWCCQPPDEDEETIDYAVDWRQESIVWNKGIRNSQKRKRKRWKLPVRMILISDRVLGNEQSAYYVYLLTEKEGITINHLAAIMFQVIDKNNYD